MPANDKTGPEGKGTKTGRQLGDCEGATPIGRGFGRGMGFGRGFCRRGFSRFDYARPVELTKEQQRKILEAEKAELEAELKEIEKELKE